MLSDETLDRILSLSALGTPTPWRYVTRAERDERSATDELHRLLDKATTIVEDADSELHVLMRNSIADLVNEVKAARATLAAVRNTCEVQAEFPDQTEGATVFAYELLAILDGKGGG